MSYNFDCDFCKKNKAIEEYGGRILIWHFKNFDRMYAAKICENYEGMLVAVINHDKITSKQNEFLLDKWGITIGNSTAEDH